MSLQASKRLFSVDEYYQMCEAGILTEDDRVELIEGEVVQMTAIGSRHAGCVLRLNRLFTLQVGEKALTNVQNPLRLDEHNEPQPDIALLKPRPDTYTISHPGPDDVLLVVEVAETSIEYDRNVKIPLYARFNIPELWLVDISSECIECYREPSPQGYAVLRKCRRGESLIPRSLPGVTINVDDILS